MRCNERNWKFRKVLTTRCERSFTNLPPLHNNARPYSKTQRETISMDRIREFSRRVGEDTNGTCAEYRKLYEWGGRLKCTLVRFRAMKRDQSKLNRESKFGARSSGFMSFKASHSVDPISCHEPFLKKKSSASAPLARMENTRRVQYGSTKRGTTPHEADSQCTIRKMHWQNRRKRKSLKMTEMRIKLEITLLRLFFTQSENSYWKLYELFVFSREENTHSHKSRFMY